MYYIIKSIVSDIHQLQRRPFNKYIRIDPPSLSGKLNILWFGFTVVWILYFINFQLSDTSLRKIQKCGLLLKLKFFPIPYFNHLEVKTLSMERPRLKYFQFAKRRFFCTHCGGRLSVHYLTALNCPMVWLLQHTRMMNWQHYHTYTHTHHQHFAEG